MKTELATFQEKQAQLASLIFETQQRTDGELQYIDTAGTTKSGINGVLRLLDVDQFGLYIAVFSKGMDRRVSFEFFDDADTTKVSAVLLDRIGQMF